MIQVLDKAWKILDLIRKAEGQLSLSQICQEVDWPKSTVYHILQSLVQLKVVEQDEFSHNYRLGRASYALAKPRMPQDQVLDLARPLLRQVAQKTGETVYLGYLDEEEMALLYQVEGRSDLVVKFQPDVRLPLHCTAGGKFLLAHRKPADIQAYLYRRALTQPSPHTLTPEGLRQELPEIRRRGLALEDGEYRIGLRGLATGVWQANELSHVIGLVGLYRRRNAPELLQAADYLRAASKQLCGLFK